MVLQRKFDKSKLKLTQNEPATMIPAIDVPTELTNRKTAPDNFVDKADRREDTYSLNTPKNYGQRLTDPTSVVADEIAPAPGERSNWLKLIEKSVIIHRDENGFGLRIKGQAPVFVEHVHENGAAWRAGVRQLDRLSKVNGISVANLDHKEVVLIFKSCTRFVALTLFSSLESYADSRLQSACQSRPTSSCARSYLGGSVRFVLEDSGSLNENESIASRSPFSAQYSPFEPKSGSYYEDTILAARQQLTVAKPAHRSQSSQSFYLTHLRHRQPATNGNTNYYFQQTSSVSPNISARTSPISDKQAPGISATARRCESVSVQPSQAGRLTSKQLTIQAHRSADERCTSNCELDHQVRAICINCRRQLRDCQAGDSDPSTAQRLTCCSERQLTAPESQRTTLDSSRNEQIASTIADGKQQLEMGTMKKLIFAADNRDDFKLRQSASTNSLRLSAGTKLGAPSAISISPSRSSTQQIPHPGPPVVNKRMEIIKEFIDTEKAHTDRLRCLDELFYRPLKAGKYMTSEQLRMVFSCHRTLYKIHRQIYRILRSANYDLFTEPLIGSALREIFESDLKRRLERASCSFCAAQSTNAELLNKLTRRETKVGDFLAQVTSQQMIGRLGIKDLLASCFQRLTKYPLLLENLLKATPIPPVITRKRRSHRNNQATGTIVQVGANGEPNQSGPGDVDNTSAAFDDEEAAEDEDEEEEEEEEEEEVRNARRMLAISLAEEREFIERALQQSRQILVKVNESVKVAMSHNKLKEIWKRTDKHPGVPLIDITKQQMVHEGLLTLRLSKRSFDVYVLLLNDYIIILTREGQDKYRLKFFTPEGKSSALTSSSAGFQTVYSPVFVIDEHLATRDAATDENGFYLLCKRKDDSRIYEFASRSPAERIKWRDRIQWTIERQIIKAKRRPSCESALTKSSSEISARLEMDDISGGTQTPASTMDSNQQSTLPTDTRSPPDQLSKQSEPLPESNDPEEGPSAGQSGSSNEPTKIEGTISYVEDDGIVMPSKMGSSRALVEQAIQVNIVDSTLSKSIQRSS